MINQLENDSDEFAIHGASSNEDKTIPFLRRLHNMLQENDGKISFLPGKENSNTVLGRIVVHDRVQVESQVLPRYFNHSSFASLRRQLNYFNFVRLGKGRQRESTYVNAEVVELDDILRLKRRSAGGPDGKDSVEVLREQLRSDLELSGLKKITFDSETSHIEQLSGKRKKSPRTKNPRSSKGLKTISPQCGSPSESQCVSEDEHMSGSGGVSVDLTEPQHRPDDDILVGAAAVLSLRSNC